MAGQKIGYALASVGQFTDVDLTKRNNLLQREFDDQGNEYIYLTGAASTAAGDWVFYNSASAQSPGLTSRLPAGTATNGVLAVAMAAVGASQFGWYQIFGLTPTYTAVKTDAAADGKSIAANSGTVGQVIPGPVTTKNIFGAVCVGASANNTGTVYITYPYEFGSATI